MVILAADASPAASTVFMGNLAFFLLLLLIVDECCNEQGSEYPLQLESLLKAHVAFS